MISIARLDAAADDLLWRDAIDAEREWAYGPDSKIGTFSDALMVEAEKSGWTVISMKNNGRRFIQGVEKKIPVDQ